MTTTTNKTINKANVASSSFSFPNSTREEQEEEKNLKLERK